MPWAEAGSEVLASPTAPLAAFLFGTTTEMLPVGHGGGSPGPRPLPGLRVLLSSKSKEPTALRQK